jgi:menaquinone-dependent protoporphyrinogen oxidase
MKPIAVLYATREGHTHKIAERLVEDLRAAGVGAEAFDLATQAGVDLRAFAGAILAGSIHQGKHEKELSRFVKDNRESLDRIPTALLSVSLSEAGVERPDYSEAERTQAATDVQRLIAEFEAETGWHPGQTKPVAGALLYSKYNLLIRFVMKLIAKKARADTDTSRDYDYTDWASLDRFAQEFVAEVRAHAESELTAH